MKTTLTISVLGAFALVACAHEQDNRSPATTTTTTGARSNAPISQSVIDAIASARCDREVTCNNVGTDKKWSNRQACISEVRGKQLNELTEASCPKGVDQTQYDKCLADIKGERCENALDTLSRLAACRTSALCPN